MTALPASRASAALAAGLLALALPRLAACTDHEPAGHSGTSAQSGTSTSSGEARAGQSGTSTSSGGQFGTPTSSGEAPGGQSGTPTSSGEAPGGQSGTSTSPGEARGARPNVLLIVADDLGYTDLGAFGSEIATPNLDALADEGLLLAQFYASAMCSPSRAMLLSGVDNHLAGVGTLHEKIADNQRGRPGYEGHLSARIAPLPAILRAHGYRTYMAGKWHLGESEAQSPAAAGFERSFALVESGASHFADMLSLSDPRPALYREDGEPVERLPEDFYSSRFYADRVIDYIADGLRDGQPFFAYLAFTAPHFPLQAPDEAIARYAGRYDAGYDELHRQRLAALEERGLVPPGIEPFPRLPAERPWAELDPGERRVSARRMEVYAAMIDELDRHVGRVLDFLKSTGEYENTLIVFLSDNGAEGHWLHQGLRPLAEYAAECCDDTLENMGRPGSYTMLGPNWARVATGPYRLFKGFTSEGGIRVPAIVHYPRASVKGVVVDQPLTIMDVVPTVLELAGIPHPAPGFEGREVLPLQGRSLAPLLAHGDATVHPEFSVGWEFLGKRAYRLGDWKIVWQPGQPAWEPWPAGIATGRWQLYDLARDPAELRDLGEEHPDKLREMIGLWETYARASGVVHPDWISDY